MFCLARVIRQLRSTMLHSILEGVSSLSSPFCSRSVWFERSPDVKTNVPKQLPGRLGIVTRRRRRLVTASSGIRGLPDVFEYSRISIHALVAQRLEQRTHNPLVVGSNPTEGTIFDLGNCFGSAYGNRTRLSRLRISRPNR
jgi:hypothetical protein